MKKNDLYFIALIPPGSIAQRISLIKEDFASRFNAVQALKIVPHITLQRPFFRSEVIEAELFLGLQDHFEMLNSFKIELKNYSCFEGKNKVIYIRVIESVALINFQKKLVSFLQREFKFSDMELTVQFHPHVTIAYKDLTSEKFVRAWREYKEKTFDAVFIVDAAYLMKHDFKSWNRIGKFNLDVNSTLNIEEI